MIGLSMMAVLGLAIVLTGLPVWALLLGVSSVFAAAGVALGGIDTGILSAVPARMVGLLEHDLLQALPLYVLVGVLLQRLAVADAMFALAQRVLKSPALAALGLGALLAPMNGSVASSSALLSRLLAPRLGGMPAPRAVALASVAATIGVVVPPSLVLILLGDAMLRAHTEASNLPGGALASGARIVNTQDVLHAALLPAALVLLGWMLVAWWQNRGSAGVSNPTFEPKPQSASVDRRFIATNLIAMTATTAIVLLLVSVFTGKMFAVEAAATGGCALVLATLLARSLSAAQWQEVLGDALAQSGALLALLVAASTFSLVFRAFGSDAALAQWFAPGAGNALSPQGAALALLLLIALCAWVLDAFEMIFVIVPILAPLLIARLGDAQQAAVLLLLVLQLGFILPPMGYAVLMARAHSGFAQVATKPLLKALWPYASVTLAVIAIVFIVPSVVHGLDDAAAPVASASPASDQDIVRQMEDMARQSSDAPSK